MSLVRLIQEKKEYFRKSIEAELAKEQAACPHNEVAHWDGFSEYSTMYPTRICLECGLEEEGGWWCYSIDCSHWHPRESIKDGKFITAKLGSSEGRTFMRVSFDELMKLRP